MKVLFLDIDGVLNNSTTKERCLFWTGVDRKLSKRLLDFLKDKEINIVLSSTWRNHPEMHDHLREAGISWIDVTPHFPNQPRGAEIRHWLKNNQPTCYAILDDCTDMLPEQFSCFVQTDANVGLSEKDIEKLSTLFT